jgi:hypothetical protein
MLRSDGAEGLASGHSGCWEFEPRLQMAMALAMAYCWCCPRTVHREKVTALFLSFYFNRASIVARISIHGASGK